MSRGALAAAELQIRIGALLRGVRSAVARRAERTAALDQPDLRHMAITEKHAHVLLDEANAFARSGRNYGLGAALSREELDRLAYLEHQAGGFELPCRALRRRGLDELDLELLLLAAAPAVEPSFGGLYGYLHDAPAATAASARLAVEVLATDADHERRVLEAAGPFGLLRTERLLLAGASDGALRPADGVLELLWGGAVDTGALGRRAVPLAGGPLPGAVNAELVVALADAFGSGRVDVVGVWGAPAGGLGAVAAALVAGRPWLRTGAEDLGVQLQRACVTGAVCVIDVPADADARAEIAEAVAASAAAVVLLGEEPLRSAALWTSRRVAELPVPAPRFADRRASWSAALPGLGLEGVEDLAARFRLLPDEVAAVAALDRTTQSWAQNGHHPGIDALAGMVSRRRSSQMATVLAPVRGPEMLVLPPAEREQVMAVAAAARAWPRVAERWRLDRFGNPGVTALFTGDPGTGKTLAAEVIARHVALDLMVVDLSQLVSKWIGETEKNLDALFTEAESSSCVLFFDEADTVFGQRGEVTRGSDRYANGEVAYLLQRLERYEGLVILASNLRGNIDAAFTRRFHHVVHFPRPGETERRRLWELALGPPVELAAPIDVQALAGLDLTGAGIAAVVRSAALAAHAAGRDALSPADLVAAICRQFQRESRLLPSELLGPYAALAV